jgi:hypothetical protein
MAGRSSAPPDRPTQPAPAALGPDSPDGAGDSGPPVPLANEGGQAGKACVLRLVVDGSPFSGSLRDVPTVTIERVEAYWGPNLPAAYAGTRAACGVLMIWTRRP